MCWLKRACDQKLFSRSNSSGFILRFECFQQGSAAVHWEIASPALGFEGMKLWGVVRSHAKLCGVFVCDKLSMARDVMSVAGPAAKTHVLFLHACSVVDAPWSSYKLDDGIASAV